MKGRCGWSRGDRGGRQAAPCVACPPPPPAPPHPLPACPVGMMVELPVELMAAVSEGGRGSRSVNTCPDSDVSNEMDNVFHDREGVCPMDADAMRKLAEV